MNPSKKSINPVDNGINQIILTLVVAIGILFSFFFVGKSSSDIKITTQINGDKTLEYKNTTRQFSILYPEDLSFKEYDEGGGTYTIVFEEKTDSTSSPQAADKGFQIFFTPYSEPQVSPERFLLDVPSGVRKDVLNLEVDGVLGTSFSSTNASLGETWEVWFIHEGFLYEVTTLKPLEPLLNEVIQTWKFTR